MGTCVNTGGDETLTAMMGYPDASSKELITAEEDRSYAIHNQQERRIGESYLFYLAVTMLGVGTLIFLKYFGYNSLSVIRDENMTLQAPSTQCSDEHCRLSLVESMPEGDLYPVIETHMPTFDAWRDLITSPKQTLDIASFYWDLQNPEHSNASMPGHIVYALLDNTGKIGVDVRIVQNAPSRSFPQTDTEQLLKRHHAKVRSLDFKRLMHGGVLHTKFILVDRKHFYIGSANMDWKSLTEVKELGVLAKNCGCLGEDLAKIFEVYWILGNPDAVVPPSWPTELGTRINRQSPLLLNDTIGIYITSSPPPFSPRGRSDDSDSIVEVILSAERFVYISVMDYEPAIVMTGTPRFWPKIDNALRQAALENRVHVKLLISWWNHSRPEQDHYLRSLTALTDTYPHVDIQVKRFIVPSTPEQAKIPFARVNHNKYMVTEQVAYIGTSNWSGDYFTNTAGVAFVLRDTVPGASEVRSQLQSVFERDWNSPYATNETAVPSDPVTGYV